MGEQEDILRDYGFPLSRDGERDDKEMLVSLDRIDISANSTPDNEQLVCRL